MTIPYYMDLYSDFVDGWDGNSYFFSAGWRQGLICGIVREVVIPMFQVSGFSVAFILLPGLPKPSWCTVYHGTIRDAITL